MYCAEVENALAAHPDVVEVAVIGRLTGYEQPAALVVVDALPRDASGKIVKPALRAAHAG